MYDLKGKVITIITVCSTICAFIMQKRSI